MDKLVGLLLGFLVYVLPFIMTGVLIFFALSSVFFIVRYCFPQRFTRGFIRVGVLISICVAVVLAMPAYLYFLFNTDHPRPQDEAMTRLKHEMQRDGRDQAWPAGTITELEQWIDREGGEFKDKMRLEVASQIARLIDENKLQTNDSDFVFIEKLANRPYALDSYSVGIVASAIAYVHLSRNGFDDVGHPERFRRAPGHLPIANQTDYTTYVKVAMVRCTQEPEMKGCRETFNEASVTRFGTEPEGANTLNWYDRLHVVEPLRAALGYPPLEK